MKLVLETADGVRALGDGEGDSDVLTAVLPGDDIALHRVQLIETGAADRLEEARMRAVDLAARPVEDLHVAVGPADMDGASWIAIIDRARMQGHLEHLQAAGITPQHVVPAALLLPPADNGPSLARLDDRLLLRTADLGGLVEPELAPAMAAATFPPRLAQLPDFAPALPAALPLDLLQGGFAPRRAWWRGRRFQVAAALLALILLLALAAPAVISRTRAAASIAAYDQGVIEMAAQATGQRPASADAAAALLRDTRRTVEGAALAARLSYATAAVEAVPESRLEAARLLPDGALELQLGGPADAVNRLSAQLLAGPFVAEADGLKLTMRDRRAGIAANRTPLSDSMLRFVNARQDSAIVQVRRNVGALPPAAVGAAFAAAGLADAQLTTAPTGTRVDIAAARSPVLLPLLADLELKGARIRSAEITRNPDSTLKARLEMEP